METVLSILTGIGLAVAAGFRPFLPVLVAGLLAALDLTIDFDGTDLAFLESPGWLIAVAIALVLALVAQRRFGEDRIEAGPPGAVVRGLALAFGALLFAGALADSTDVWWPGLLGGIACALLAQVAVRDLLRRTRARLDAATRGTLIVYADAAALAVAVLAVLLPPLSLVALGLCAFLLRGGRRREGERYAGLRILR